MIRFGLFPFYQLFRVFSEIILAGDSLVYFGPTTVCDNYDSDTSDADTERRKNPSTCRDTVKPTLSSNDDDKDDDDAAETTKRLGRQTMPESAVSTKASSTAATETTSSNNGEGTSTQHVKTALSKH